ncbi:S9 family peptidase [Dyella solisilvae]|uniref:S9 family peptidase n=1 Tax=Dyella solisilvae TaxID=1920168 RepID=A0A370KBM1_9GAMM|nr:S9 family peptidase [Dyella solisilvae]RDJ00054.1 S9 family peptidase [Dyella solisilvae]
MKNLLRRATGCALCLFASVAWSGTVSIADLARHVQYDEVKISDDGQHLAARTVINGKPLLALIDLKTQKGAMVTPREGNQVADFWWVNDHRLVYIEGTKVSGFDRPFLTGEIFGVNADGTGADLLFGYRAGSGERSATHIQHRESERGTGELIDTIKGDENHVLIGVNPWEGGAEGSFTQVFTMDVRNGNKYQQTTAPVRNARFLADHHGTVRFAMGVDSHDYPQVFYREGDGKPWRLLFQGTLDKGVPYPRAFNRDESVVYMNCAAAGKVGALCPWQVSSQTLQAPVWSSDEVTAGGLIYSLDREDVVGVYSMPGRPTAEAITPGADAMRAIILLSKALPGESVRIVSSTADGKKAVALASSDMDPGTYYLLDVETGKAAALLQRADWIRPANMAAMEPVKFKARDGAEIHGYLSMPPGREQAKHLPMVVYVHGGPFGVRDHWEYDSYVQLLATRGYAVLQVNFRGSGGYGEEFEASGYRQWGGAMQDDVTDATRWAIEQGYTSAGHVCIFGGSYGGYAALEGAVKEPDLYRCAIGYVGVYDLPMLYTDGDVPGRLAGKAFLQTTLGTDSNVLAEHSPVNQLDKLKANVMLVVGGQDTRVPPAQGMSLHMALNRRGVPHEWLYKSNEGHGFYDEKNTAELYERVVGFLDRNIGTSSSMAAGSP